MGSVLCVLAAIALLLWALVSSYSEEAREDAKLSMLAFPPSPRVLTRSLCPSL
jgi:hypothetical protein